MVYRFAECELDEHLYQVRRDGVPVALEPKVFDVLAYLVQHRDRVVSKDELLDKLWPGQVVGENALTRCIRAARAAGGDIGSSRLSPLQCRVLSSEFRVNKKKAVVSSQQEEKNQKAKVEEIEQLSSLDEAQRGIQGRARESPGFHFVPSGLQNYA